VVKKLSLQKRDTVTHRDYVAEAAETLDAPGEIWLFRDKIFYDPANREWRCIGSYLKELRFIGETRYWVLRICGWLQFKYPEGPTCSI